MKLERHELLIFCFKICKLCLQQNSCHLFTKYCLLYCTKIINLYFLCEDLQINFSLSNLKYFTY